MRRTAFILALAACGLAPLSHAADTTGVVSHIKVLSDKVEDVSSLDAWKRSFIKDGMTDEQKALAVWESVYRFRHQDIPPNEYLSNEGHPHDPIKDFNVYGYGQCCCASANVEALARSIGMEARGWGIVQHSVPEVRWGNAWHMLDSSLMTYFPKSDGSIAGVEEITADIAKWYEQHPEYMGNDKKLRAFMPKEGWKNGPELLRQCPAYDANGWLPAATHGWYSTMQEYGTPKKTFVYEYGTALGYELNVQLRRGERLTRNWSNRGLHVNADDGGAPDSLTAVPGKDQLRYTPKHGDIAPGRVGNGTLEYDVPLADGGFRGGALVAENLAAQGEDHQAPAVHLKDAAQPGTLVIRMPSSYVYLGGSLDFNAVCGIGGGISVAFSDNNGLDWKDVAKVTASGAQHIDLKPLILRRYDYRLRFTLSGQGTGIDSLKIANDIQHSQRALPALAAGDNKITFSSGPQEGTITVEGSTSAANTKGRNVLLADFHPELKNIRDDMLFLKSDAGAITLPVWTPGNLTRLRIGAHYRARDKADGFDVQVSFDDGKTFKTIDRLAGPTGGNSRYLVVSDVPTGKKAALVRLSGQQRNTTGILDLRISADYTEPHGGFSPVKVTYAWDEAGGEKRDVHVAKSPQEAYTIHCDGKPLLKRFAVELAE